MSRVFPRRATSRLLVAGFSLGLVLAGAAAGEDVEPTNGASQTPEAKSPATGAENPVPAVVRENGPLPELELTRADGAVTLSLDEAVAIGLERNLTLRVERYRRSRSLVAVLEAMGIYDFQLGAFAERTGQTTPSTSSLEETGGTLTQDTSTWTADLSRLLPTGAVATASFTNFWRENNDTNSLNPLYASGFDLSLTQPLLRSFGKLATERLIIQARLDSRASRETFELAVGQLIEAVHTTYWDLVEARQQLEVAEESLRLAKELHEMNRIQVDVGTLAPLELVQSEAGVATRDEEIIRRRAEVADRADELRRLLNFEAGELWEAEIRPTTDPAVPYVEIEEREAIGIALAERPELRRERLVNEALEVDAEFFHNQRKPRLDLVARYGLNGINVIASGNPDLPIAAGDYRDALDQLITNDAYDWEVSVLFAVPLGNRVARARAASADLAFEEGGARLEDLEQQVTTDVRRRIRAVSTARQQIESAKVSSKLARRNLEAEQKRYENGLSTSFKVLEIQEDLAQARSREVTAITTYRRALADYEQGIGRLLEAYGVELEDPGEDGGYREVMSRASAP